jgi:hypothetical protein
MVCCCGESRRDLMVDLAVMDMDLTTTKKFPPTRLWIFAFNEA